MANIGALAHLTAFTLTACPGAREGELAHLGRLHRLADLDLRDCTGVTDAALAAALPELGRLTSLCLAGCFKITDAGKFQGARPAHVCLALECASPIL